MKALAFLCLSSSILASESGDKAWSVMNTGLSHEDPIKRRKALNALGTAGTPAAVAKIEAALNDKNDGVRQTAVATLGQSKSRRSIPLLKKALDDEAPEVSFMAAKALWEMGDRSGKDILMGVLLGERGDTAGVFSRKM